MSNILTDEQIKSLLPRRIEAFSLKRFGRPKNKLVAQYEDTLGHIVNITLPEKRINKVSDQSKFITCFVEVCLK